MTSCNILRAIERYAMLDKYEMGELYESSNKINQKGDKLEFFIKDLFCGSFEKTDKEKKEDDHREHLSWLGRQNHPPDFMIRGGDAVEVKKTSSKAGSIQLNSSHPHQKLTSTYSRLTEECTKCEDDVGGWDEKDMLYALGRIKRGSDNLDFMWMIYGDCWCAPSEMYDELSNKISSKLNEAINELEYGTLNEDTNEIGRVNGADPQARTKLRIRPMWLLEHPANYFASYFENYSEKIEKKQPLFTVMREEKFNSFPQKDRDAILNNPNVDVIKEDIPNPESSNDRVKALIICAE